MPIRFFKPINPMDTKQLKGLEDMINIFEYNVDKIHSVFSSATTIGSNNLDMGTGKPLLIVGVHYSSKVEEEEEKPEEEGIPIWPRGMD